MFVFIPVMGFLIRYSVYVCKCRNYMYILQVKSLTVRIECYFGLCKINKENKQSILVNYKNVLDDSVSITYMLVD